METTSVTSSDYSSAVLSALSSSSDSSTTSTSAEELYNSWISILCAQLENQDPTNPVDATEFTNQLTSIASLEQQALTNETLGSLLTLVSGLQGDSLAGYIGSKITAYGDTAPLSDGSAEWQYDLDSTAESVTIKVLDEDGNVVYTTTGETGAGTHEFTWDGTTDDGKIAPDGAYQLVVEATDASGDDVSATLYACGTVTGVDLTGNTATLLMDGISVPGSYVVSVSKA
jgi:flagellar basal-body rod modification protein FlgD